MNLIQSKKITYYTFIFFFISFAYLFFAFGEDIKANSWQYIKFDVSMHKVVPHYKDFLREKGNEPHQFINYFNVTNIDLIDCFKGIFHANELSKKKNIKHKKIPKIIHQIWLGGKLPEKYRALQASWIKYHPDWKYKLWTEKEIEKLHVYNRDILNETIGYSGKANILRYEILYQFGGLYVDTDFECIKSFNILHENYEFYCGAGPFLKHINLCNALIASIPGHPILEYAVKNMKNEVMYWKKLSQSNYIPKWAMQTASTGIFYFTKSFFSIVKNNIDSTIYDNILILPATYFYPTSFTEANIKREQLDKRLENCPESFGIHYWGGSLN